MAAAAAWLRGPFLLAIPLLCETGASLCCTGTCESAILPAALFVLFVLELPDPIFRKLMILSPGMIGSRGRDKAEAQSTGVGVGHLRQQEAKKHPGVEIFE